MKALPSFEMAGITHPMIQHYPSTLASSAAALFKPPSPHPSTFHTGCNIKFHTNNMSSRPANETWVESYKRSHHYAIYGHAECMETTLNHILIQVQTKMVTQLTQISTECYLVKRTDILCCSLLKA
jgi:hypothetical protein